MPESPLAAPRPSKLTSPNMYDALHPSFATLDHTLNQPGMAGRDQNSYEIIPTAHHFFRGLKDRIKAAKTSVDLQFYTLEADEAVLPILKTAMDAAQERGVDVRILVDHLVSDPRQLTATMRAHRELRLTPNVAVQSARPAGKIHSPFARDHKKIAAIDVGTPDEAVYIGGINLASRSLRWNDFMVRLGGPIARLAHNDFEDSWKYTNAQGKVIPEVNEPGTYLLTDSRKDPQIVAFAREVIKQATDRIWLETPYLDVPGIGASLIEAKRILPSLDVKVIVPRFNNYPVHRLLGKSMLTPLAQAGIETYQYGVTYRRLNHTKLLLADNTAMFGSSNFNLSAMAGGNSEIEVVTQSPRLVERFADWYTEDVRESIRL